MGRKDNRCNDLGVRFLDDCIATFVANKDITGMTAQNEYSAVTFSRMTKGKEVHAIGFNADFDDADEDIE